MPPTRPQSAGTGPVLCIAQYGRENRHVMKIFGPPDGLVRANHGWRIVAAQDAVAVSGATTGSSLFADSGLSHEKWPRWYRP